MNKPNLAKYGHPEFKQDEILDVDFTPVQNAEIVPYAPQQIALNPVQQQCLGIAKDIGNMQTLSAIQRETLNKLIHQGDKQALTQIRNKVNITINNQQYITDSRQTHNHHITDARQTHSYVDRTQHIYVDNRSYVNNAPPNVPTSIQLSASSSSNSRGNGGGVENPVLIIVVIFFALMVSILVGGNTMFYGTPQPQRIQNVN